MQNVRSFGDVKVWLDSTPVLFELARDMLSVDAAKELIADLTAAVVWYEKADELETLQ